MKCQVSGSRISLLPVSQQAHSKHIDTGKPLLNLLAIETATEVCSVALACGGQTISRSSDEPRAHARLLLPMLDELLAEAGLKPVQLDGVAFGRGPGSFTGVRIGTAAAQAIALGADIPALPVSTLALIARNAWRQFGFETIAAAIDARMNEVYWAVYAVSDASEGRPVELAPECVCAPHLVDCFQSTAGLAGAGSGWHRWPDELVGACPVEHVIEDLILPQAIDALEIGRLMLNNDEGVDAELALPVYLRDNVARTEKERNAN